MAINSNLLLFFAHAQENAVLCSLLLTLRWAFLITDMINTYCEQPSMLYSNTYKSLFSL